MKNKDMQSSSSLECHNSLAKRFLISGKDNSSESQNASHHREIYQDVDRDLSKQMSQEIGCHVSNGLQRTCKNQVLENRNVGDFVVFRDSSEPSNKHILNEDIRERATAEGTNISRVDGIL